MVGLALAAARCSSPRARSHRRLARAASSELAAAQSAFYRLEDDRAEFAAAQAALVTTLPVFRVPDRFALSGDLATMQVMAGDYRQQAPAAFVIVTGRDGSWTGSGWTRGLACRRPRCAG
jgi:hypothetical protein